MLEAPTYGTIQYHPSLLPEHRGPSSINWPIIEGKSKTGLTIFWPDEGLDTGPILLQKETEIDPDDTLGSVYFGRLYPMGIEAMIEAVNMVKSGNAAKIQQDHSKATYQGWCRAGDAVIDWADTAANIYNMIRGCDPSPGANTILGSNKISFFKASFSQTKSEAIPGTVIGIDDDSFSLAAKGGIISIGRVQLDRDPKLMAGEFVGTGAIQIGKRFGV